MQSIPNDVEPHDIWQWLNNGWFFYESEQGKLPARLEQEDRNEFVVYGVDGTSYPYRYSRVFPHWPECGAVNLQGFAVIVRRQQTRQYRRTYNARCVLLDVPRKWDVMKRHPFVKDITPDHPDVVCATFSPEYYNYERALELLEGGWISVALNPYLIVAGERDQHLVYYRGKLLANVNEGELMPLDNSNPRNVRILKWFNGRVRYANSTGRHSQQSVPTEAG